VWWLVAATLLIAPGERPPAEPPPGTTIELLPGVHVPFEVTGEDLTVRGQAGAVIDAGGEGHGLVASGKRVRVQNLEVRNTGPNYDFYDPDSAVFVVECEDCLVEDLRAEGVITALRAEDAPGLVVRRVRAVGNRQGPGITLYQCPNALVEDNHLDSFLDNLYMEYTDQSVVRGNRLVRSFRYGYHLMFSKDVEVYQNVAERGRVGSAVMYGRRVHVYENRFEGHVGPLAFGLLQHESVFEDNLIRGNNVGILIVSAVEDVFRKNRVEENGFGVLVLREKNKVASAALFEENVFLANVYDLAVDDPEAKVTLRENAFDRASRLDLDKDGYSDVPYLPSSSFALLASRMLDLSLFAKSPGITLWEEAEKKVPGLRLLTLTDPRPRILLVPPGTLSLAGLALAGLALAFGLWLRS